MPLTCAVHYELKPFISGSHYSDDLNLLISSILTKHFHFDIYVVFIHYDERMVITRLQFKTLRDGDLL